MASSTGASRQMGNWAAGVSYVPGDIVSFGGLAYVALQAERSIPTWAPDLTLALWKPMGAASGGPGTPGPPPVAAPVPAVPSTPASYAPAWSANAVYLAGTAASENGIVYKANWWTQGNDPASSSGIAGSGQPWTAVGPLKPVTVVPTVPGTPTAGGTGSTGTTLYWSAATVPGGGDVKDYVVTQNGVRIATVTGTSLTVSGLEPGHTYSYAVAAEDGAGLSAPSMARSVTTLSIGRAATAAPAFAPYVDMGLAADDDLAALSRASGARTFTLAFLQSNGHGAVGWSGVGTLADDTLANGTTILDQVNALRASGGDVIISFGGAAGTDPAAIASSSAQLQAEYQSVIDRYHVSSLDFDIEGAEVADQHAMLLRDQALLGLKAANPGLLVSYTLPVLPDGLDSNGMAVLRAAKADGMTPDVVNLMTMDYGASVDHGGAMGADAIMAAQATLAQMHGLGLASRLGITPMIGVNDVASEVFTQADATALLAFAQGNPDVARLAFWSIARDNGAGAGQRYASADTSGIVQKPFEFSSIFAGFGAKG